jgi:hypothetical protein
VKGTEAPLNQRLNIARNGQQITLHENDLSSIKALLDVGVSHHTFLNACPGLFSPEFLAYVPLLLEKVTAYKLAHMISANLDRLISHPQCEAAIKLILPYLHSPLAFLEKTLRPLEYMAIKKLKLLLFAQFNVDNYIFHVAISTLGERDNEEQRANKKQFLMELCDSDTCRCFNTDKMLNRITAWSLQSKALLLADIICILDSLPTTQVNASAMQKLVDTAPDSALKTDFLNQIALPVNIGFVGVELNRRARATRVKCEHP